jgi:hypothetical protein
MKIIALLSLLSHTGTEETTEASNKYDEGPRFIQMFQFNPEERIFYLILIAFSWLSNTSLGLSTTVLWPTQP